MARMTTVARGRWTSTTMRKDFPLLAREVNGHPIIYLDSAASSQRPDPVLDAMREYDETTHANVHRGVYAIAEEATRRFEAARVDVGRFIGAPRPSPGDRLRQERHRGPQPGGPHLGPHPPPRR